jgi:uncharacterized protein
MTDDLERLRRWEDSGAIWRVLARTTTEVEIALLRCDAGEQVDGFRSTEPALLAYVDSRDIDHDERDERDATPAENMRPGDDVHAPDPPMEASQAVLPSGDPVTRFARDRDDHDRARNARPRDALGRPLSPGSAGVPTTPDDINPSPQQALAEAQRLLDADRPFHAHEVLEAAWKAAPPQERELWRGLAQLAVGVTHARRGNAIGASRLLRRCADRIEPYAPSAPHRVMASDIAAWARHLAERIEKAGLGDISPNELIPTLVP